MNRKIHNGFGNGRNYTFQGADYEPLGYEHQQAVTDEMVRERLTNYSEKVQVENRN